MNRLIKLCVSFLMAFSILTGAVKEEIIAQGNSVGCDAYEVAWVNDSGGFDTISCHNTFEEAKSAMNQDDYVVRHASSKSPTKIIAIASGIAYSYPKRNGSLTMNVYQSSSYVNDHKYKVTYVVQHRELSKPETISYNGNGEGNVQLVLNGFTGYAKLSEMDLVPMKFITNGLKLTLGGQTSDNSEDPFTLVPKQNYYSVVKNGNYTDLVFHFFSGYDGTQYTLTIGKAADWMSVGAVYYSADGYQFYADREMSEYLATYYNYYQFLPLRSASSISAETLDAYLATKGYTEKPTSTSINQLTKKQSQLVNEGATFVSAQNTYGVNALMVYAMGCLESSYGRSNFAVSKNNLFGWAAIDDNPGNATAFSSISNGITEHMAYNLRGYMDITDVRYFGMHVGNKGSGFNVKYASDPYWGMKIAAIAYDIDKFSKKYDGTYTDYDVETLGLIHEFGASFLLNASVNGKILSTSEYSRYYQDNHTVVIHGETNGYYQVQFTNAILDGEGNFLKHKVSGVMQNATPYDFEKSVAYMNQNSITLLTDYNNVTIPGYEPTGEFVCEFDEFAISDTGELKVSGKAYRPGIYITDSNQLIHTLAVFNQYYEKITEVRFNTELMDNTDDVAVFEGLLDLNELEDGTYYFRMYSDYSALEEYNDTRELVFDHRAISTNTKNYVFDNTGEYTMMTVTSRSLSDPSELTLISSLKSINLNEDGILSLHGISLIRDFHHLQDTVNHELIAVNMSTEEEISLGKLDASTGDYNLTEVYSDGYAYDYGWYDGSVDVSTLPVGNYTLYVKTTLGEISKSAKIYGTSKMSESDMIKGSDGLYRQLVMRYAVSYRVEISVTPYKLDKELKNKLPRIREGYQNLIAMVFDEQTKSVNVYGSAFIWNGIFDSTSEVEYVLYALNRTDGTIYSYSVEGSNQLMGDAPPWNNTERINSGYVYDYTWYELNMPLSEMTDGVYDFVLKIETKDYVEYIDLKKSSVSGLSNYQFDSDHYVQLSVDRNNKNRVMMQLKGFNVSTVSEEDSASQ
ncbi:MAG: glucosaminidase domain-containing protein [Erysipelotrichaceae bacterium]|nr:glucosaminidase domain-containing protein [Erysipelotrichaceae bacterium]